MAEQTQSGEEQIQSQEAQPEGRIRSTEPFTYKDKFGYLFGDLGNNMMFMLQSSFLLVFYTQVLGIEGAVAGTLFFVARIADAFTDIGMGKLVDKAPAKKEGKFKPWIKRIAGPVALASFLMYQSGVAAAPMWVRIVYMYVTYLLWGSVLYTAINIPYGSMASAITDDPAERTSLSVFRGAAGALAGMFVGAVVPLFIYQTDAQGNEAISGSMFTLVAGLFAILAIIFYIWHYKWTTERVVVEQQEEESSFGDSMKQVLKSRSLVSLTAASILLLMSMLLIQQMANYVFPYYYGNGNLVSLNAILMSAASLGMLPVASVLSKQIGKKETGAIGMAVGAVSYIILFFWQPANPYIFIVFNIISYGSIGLFNGTVWAAITDVIDNHEIETGQREDGTIYGINSFARKVGQSLAGGLPGFALTFVGWQSGSAAQSAEALSGIFNVATLVPAVGITLIFFVLAFWYPLDKNTVYENQEILSRKHAENNK